MLSGGWQQQVAIARALVVDLEPMLFDEPASAAASSSVHAGRVFGGASCHRWSSHSAAHARPGLVGEVLAVMRQPAGDGMTMVVVTYEMGFVREVGGSLVFMVGGVLVEQGSPRNAIGNPGHERTTFSLGKVLMQWLGSGRSRHPGSPPQPGVPSFNSGLPPGGNRV